ncbi:MAG: alpha/beta hydrolase [Armatimonadetes bacterium]|nr:alpha/beta hydrolase [Armatimonadota bacterium]
MVVLRDQDYPVSGGSLKFDFMRPDGEGPYPLVVFIHGGGWISGDKSMYREEAGWLVPQGFACACIEYRLAPLYPFPVPVADCQAFVRYARENATQLGIDRENVTAMGNSAGGHMALMLGLCQNRFDESDSLAERVDAVVDICGLTDLRNPRQANYELAMAFLEQFMDGPYEGREDVWAQASPVTYVRDVEARFLVIHGTQDEVVPIAQSEELVRLLQAQGGEVKFCPLEDEGHSFTYEGWDRIRSEYLGFLTKVRAAR